MQFDDDIFLPLFVKLSTSPYCTNISSRYNGPHYDDNAQHGNRYTRTECTTHPLPGKSQCTHLSTVNVHNKIVPTSPNLCHNIVHAVVDLLFTYVTIVRLAIVVSHQ
jgi:hypothetical protein